MGIHRVSFWSVDNGAASTSAFAALEDAAAAAGGNVSEPWSVQVSVQRSGASNDPSDILERRTGDATKDLHVVSFRDDPSKLILVHRHGRTVLMAETGAKSLLDNYLKYKTRATLHLDGLLYTNCGGGYRIALLRATQRPSNRFIGIVVDIEAIGLATVEAADGILTEMTQLFREAAQSNTPKAKLQEVDKEINFDEYGVAEDAWKEQWALQLVQVFGG